MYQGIINNVPTIIWPFFLGAWIDNYQQARKIILVIGAITHCAEATINFFNCYYFESDVNLILLSFLPNALIGSMTLGTAYSYLAITTPEHLRTIRISIFDNLDALAHLCGVLSYGSLINKSPVWSNGQVHNYGLIYFISSITAFLAIVWSLFFINQRKEQKLFLKYFGGTSPENNQEQITNKIGVSKICTFDNVREVLQTCFKKRKDYIRSQIWLTIVGIFTYLFVLMSVPSYEFQFYQNIYKWDAKDMSFWESIGLIANTVFVLTLTPILVKVFKIKDLVLSIIGFSGLMLRMVCLAIILSPKGYYLSVLFSCTTFMASIGLKTHLSKIVDQNELGKIFTILTIMDGIAPTLAATIFTYLFKISIDSYPGLCFVILSVICLNAIVFNVIIIHLNRNNQKAVKTSERH